MSFLERLRAAQDKHGSMLCVGLDPEPARFPAALKGDPSRIYDFCARIVDATARDRSFRDESLRHMQGRRCRSSGCATWTCQVLAIWR